MTAVFRIKLWVFDFFELFIFRLGPHSYSDNEVVDPLNSPPTFVESKDLADPRTESTRADDFIDRTPNDWNRY